MCKHSTSGVTGISLINIRFEIIIIFFNIRFVRYTQCKLYTSVANTKQSVISLVQSEIE